MLLKLAALGALGYAGYRYYQTNMAGRTDYVPASPRPAEDRLAVAGGPISDRAELIEAGQPLPSD